MSDDNQGEEGFKPIIVPPWTDDPPSRRRYPITISTVHGGTWKWEREYLERRSRDFEDPQGPFAYETVWDRPGGYRGRYLDIRSRLWKWLRQFQGNRG